MSYHHLLYIHVYNYKVSSTRSSQQKGTTTKKLRQKSKGKTKKKMLTLQGCEG